MYYGLSAREMGKFAFEYAVALNIKIPESWRDTKIAGTEWLTKFLNSQITHFLRKPEETSTSRAVNLTRLMLMLSF
jgi:hypothetical protein